MDYKRSVDRERTGWTRCYYFWKLLFRYFDHFAGFMCYHCFQATFGQKQTFY